MQCEVFESRLHDLLDARQVPQSDRQLQSHARVCDDCRHLLSGQQTLFAGLDALHAPAPDDLAQRAVELAARPRSARRWTNRWMGAGVAAAAAALLLAVFLAGGDTPDSPQLAKSDHLTINDDAPHHQASGSSGAGQQPTAINRRDSLPTENVDADVQTQLSPEEYRAALKRIFDEWPVDSEQFSAVDQFAGGLKPITSSFSAALDALRRSIPGVRSIPNSEKPQAGANPPQRSQLPV